MSVSMPSQRTHGHRSVNGKKSPTYISWDSMIARCCRESHPYYEDYGGRGVQVDPRWRGQGGFERFLEDMGERPECMTLDRIDVNGHYTKDNCRWTTPLVQRWNRRDMAARQTEPSEYGPDDVVEPLFEGSGSEDTMRRRRRVDDDEEIPF